MRIFLAKKQEPNVKVTLYSHLSPKLMGIFLAKKNLMAIERSSSAFIFVSPIASYNGISLGEVALIRQSSAETKHKSVAH